MRKLKIGPSGVRGVVGDALTPELVVNFACAFGTWAKGGPVVIGRDTRRSSPMFRAAVAAGLLSTGNEIIDLGVCPTPLVSFAVRELGAAGGLSITGSHNDAQWNALKFVGPDGMLLNPVKNDELLDIYHATAFRIAPRDRLRGDVEDAPGLLDRYVEHLLAPFDVEAIRGRGFTVALDFRNGACVTTAERFLERLGCTLLPLNPEPLSRLPRPHRSDPTGILERPAVVRESQADLGAAVNVDGDRIIFVTAEGRALSEEDTLPLAALNRLERRPGVTVTNLSTSWKIDAVARRHGTEVLRTAVGESHVVERGVEEEAVLAGEGGGGVALLPVTMTFDALLTLGLILESLAVREVDLDELTREVPRFHMRKGALPCRTDQVYRIVEAFRSARVDDHPDVTDGVRVEWSDAWLHVRASATEPLLRIIVEAETEERAESLYREATAHARSILDPAAGANHA